MIDVATKPGQPPVIETVLGVHFHPIQGLTAAHFGIFWKTVLRPDWTRAVEAPPIVEQTERFSDMPSWLNISPGSVIAVPLSAHSSSRLQISNSTGDRMVQLQSNRFHYNWKRTEGPYPSYFAVREEFSQQFRHFRQFVEEQGLGQVKPFQWEVTYVDYIPPGVLWQSPEDWHKVIPGLLGGRHQDTLRLESVTGDYPQARPRVHQSGIRQTRRERNARYTAPVDGARAHHGRERGRAKPGPRSRPRCSLEEIPRCYFP
jgi:uncharacterized protein (TIGR04255 family)